MRLEGALFSSREGIITSGQAISVVGDNISNANTVGFKRSRTEFSDIMAEGQEGTSAAPIASGSGASIARVRPIHETGMLETTGRTLDAGIDGTGFFVVGDPSAPEYTRAGNLQMRSDGILSTPDGTAVLGLPPGSPPGSSLSTINLLDVNTTGQATSLAQLYGNLDASSKAGAAPSNPQTFTDIGKTASFTTVVEVFDSLGASHAVTLACTKTDAAKWNVQAYIDSGELQGGTAGKPQLLGQIDLTYGGDGVLPDASKAAAVINVQGAGTYANGASAGAYALNVSELTQFANASQLSGLTKDGKGAGQVKSYEIRSDGGVYALLDNGSDIEVGVIQLADFMNVDGLQRRGNGIYSATTESGEAVTGDPGSKTLGKLVGGSLERSTVDIATEFVDLVVYQRGYQANSQVMNVTAQMLKDAIGLMR